MRRILPLVVLAAVVHAAAPAPPRTQTRFAELIAATSEPGGSFDTDNLISNESSYLQVLPELADTRAGGGAYIGVGPDQNFTYVAQVRPSIAFIVDIRRDNLLLHLLFKAIFAHARTRLEYLAILFGRPAPGDVARWRDASIDRIVEYLDRTPAAPPDALHAQLERTIETFGVPLSAEDRRTIDRFHRGFIDAGLSLRFQTAGQAPRSYYPAYRDLLVDRDRSGRQTNVFASEESFQFVRSLEAQDLVVPVVGDLGGPTALASIGRLLEARHARLTALYASNVEYYLFRGGRFGQFIRNLASIPHTNRAVVIRSIFNYYSAGRARRGDASISRLDRVDDLLAAANTGAIRSYSDLAAR